MIRVDRGTYMTKLLEAPFTTDTNVPKEEALISLQTLRGCS